MTTIARKSQIDVLEEILEATEEAGSSDTGLTNVELRASPLAVTGPLTDAQFRSAAVAVTVGQITTVTATIALNASLSGIIDLGLMRLGRLVMPTEWTPAEITFDVSHDGETYKPFYSDDDTELVINPPVGVEREMTLSKWLSVRYLRIRSGTSSLPVPQLADRNIVLVLVP